MSRARAPRPLRRLAVLVPTVAFCLTAGASCSSSDPGLSVEVHLAPPSSPTAVDGKRNFTSDQGYEVVLSRAYLTVGSVELAGCEAARAFPAFELPLGVKSAHAHSVSSPTRLGEPGVISLTASAGSAFLLGTLEPPPGDYCALEVGLHAADSDAAQLPSDVDFVGLTLYLAGTYQKDGGEPVQFEASSDESLDAHVAMSTLSLSDGSDSPVRLTLGSQGEHWFDGVDFASDSSDAVAERVLDNVKASLEVVGR